MESHRIVSREQWIAARMALLAKEKEFTRARDRLSQERRELPWVRVDKPYVFDGPDGKVTLSDSDRLPFHVRAGMGGGVQELFVLG